MSELAPPPSWVGELADAAVRVVCTVDGHHAGDPCPGGTVMHFARFSRARDLGLITAGDLDRVLHYIGEESLYTRQVPLPRVPRP
jgi:hypothetical protein